MAKPCEKEIQRRQALTHQKARSETDLSEIRKQIYACVIYGTTVLPKHRMRDEMFKEIKANQYPPPKTKEARKANFEELVKQNFNREWGYDLAWPEDDAKMRKTHVFQQLEAYAFEDYGAVMVTRILKDNAGKEGLEKFRIEYNPHPGKKPKARGAHNVIVFSDVFDKGRHPGGELRFAKSLIHHEFGHTKFGIYRDVPSIQDERTVTIKYSNPVRVYHDLEPRYTYTHPLTMHTIAILDPNKIYPIAMTIKEDDPRILMKLNTPGARKWPK